MAENDSDLSQGQQRSAEESGAREAESFQRRAPAEREVGATPFKDAYLGKSVFFIPEVWWTFKDMRGIEGKSLTKLHNEAMAWLLQKYGKMTPELRQLFKEYRVDAPQEE